MAASGKTAVGPAGFWKSYKVQTIIGHTFIHIVLIVLGLAFVIPLLWMLITSIKPAAEVLKYPPIWIPSKIVLENYPKAMEFAPFGRYFLNTMYICVFNVIAVTASSSLIAYGLARFKFPGRDLLFISVLATLMIPYHVQVIPLYIIFHRLGWIDTFNPLTIPYLTGHPFFVFLLRQFFLTVPSELGDAAKIDGASEWGIFWRIYLPLSIPALATTALFTFMWNWNDFLGPLIFLNSQENWTLALGLNSFRGRLGAQWNLLMAATTIVLAPIVLLFFFTQRTFIQGITMTGLKE
jgi:multiple sugar transport system permease protein